MSPPGAGGGRWAKGDAYERYLGRWSAKLAPDFVRWAGLSRGDRALDIGCGTGALAKAILSAGNGRERWVCSLDPSFGFVESAQTADSDTRATFVVGEGGALPFPAGTFDTVVSGLVLNFLPDPAEGVREMARVCRIGGTVAGYVWDYTGDMWLLRFFWETVFELVPEARELDEVGRFAACKPQPLLELFTGGGLADVVVEPLDGTAEFRDFDDYWAPFLAGQGAAPSFVTAQPEHVRTAVADTLRQRLPTRSDGSISLRMRVWAVQGRVCRLPDTEMAPPRP